MKTIINMPVGLAYSILMGGELIRQPRCSQPAPPKKRLNPKRAAQLAQKKARKANRRGGA